VSAVVDHLVEVELPHNLLVAVVRDHQEAAVADRPAEVEAQLPHSPERVEAVGRLDAEVAVGLVEAEVEAVLPHNLVQAADRRVEVEAVLPLAVQPLP
jgi:hypothetical protein